MRHAVKFGTLRVTRVRELMASPVVAVREGDRLADVEAVLRDRGIGGAPVLDEAGRVVGVISLHDLLGLTPDEKQEGTAATRATRVLYGVRAEDPALSAVRLMVQEDIHRALVLDAADALVGIVTPMDVLRALADGRFGDAGGEGIDFAPLVPYVVREPGG